MKEIVKKVRRKLIKSLMLLLRVFPLNNKKIVFTSFYGASASDNPWYIFEQMVNQRPDYDYVWLLSERSNVNQIRGARIVRIGSLASLFNLATSKCWIDNNRKQPWVIKRDKQYYVQTWHGNIGFKLVEADVVNHLPVEYINGAKNDSKIADLFISGSKWLTERYRRSFWYNGKILEMGLPRADIFYKNHDHINIKVNTIFNQNPSTRFALYCPTFRANRGTDKYLSVFDELLDILEYKYGGEWKIFVKLHPNMMEKDNFIQYSKRVINASHYANINELLIRAELVITDYSSCMFDALEAGDLVILYASDMNEYMKDRGCEFDIGDIPFPICCSTDDLYKTIKSYDKEFYQMKGKEFLNKCGILNNSNSSERVAKYIIGKIANDD